MAHVFKPVYTKPIPKNAEPVRHKDGPAVRWKGRGNKWVVALVCDDNPKRCRVEAARWYVEYSDHNGTPQRKKGYLDKGATEALMADLVRQAARIQCGLLPASAAMPRRTLSELLDRWREWIVNNGSLAVVADRARQRVNDIAVGVKATRAGDLTPIAVQAWLGERRTIDKVGRYSFGKTTSNHYLGAAKAFTKWLAVVDKSESVDHLSAIRRSKPDDSELRRDRRPLTQDEFEKLIRTTRKSRAVLFGLTGLERASLYVVAASTGLRASELFSLTAASVDLKGRTVEIKGSRAKNKKTARLHLTDETIIEFRRMLRNNEGGPVWPHRNPKAPSRRWCRHGSEMVAEDLAAAGIERRIGGKQFDFHALRGQFATDLDRAGVSPIKAQRMMRLSSLQLLTKHYSKPDEDSLAEDVNKLRKKKRDRS